MVYSGYHVQGNVWIEPWLFSAKGQGCMASD